MDWLNQHLRLTVTILPVVFLTLVPGEQVSAQQGRPVPSMPSESGRPSTPGSGPLSTPGLGSGLPSTPGTGTAGSDTVPSPGSQSPNPFRAPEMPPLSPESLQPTPVTPTPGERKPERDPTRSLDRPERPAGAAALPSRSPIEQIFGGDPLQSKLSRDLRQFGYDLFREPVSTFAPVTDVPVGPEYILGPGDVMQAYLWGMVDNVLTLQVNRQGEIFVPRVGTIPVWGMPLGEVRRVIHDQLSRQYAGFRMSLNLSALRSIQVFVVGEVAQPGVYTISSLSTMVHALFAAGGPSKLGSLRTIRLIRNNRTIGTLDLYDFLLRGERARDFRIESGDTVFVPPIGPVVGVAGNVKRPAIYELTGTTRIGDMFQMAGGVSPTGYLQRVQIERVKPHTEKLILDLRLDDLKAGSRPANNPLVEDGDLIKIFPIDTRIYNVVFLEGSVRRAGEYELKNGMRLGDLLPPEEVLPEAYVDRIEVIRTRPDFTRQLLTSDLRKLWQGDYSQNLLLEPGDHITITTESRPLGAVTLQGEVKRPGTYPIIQGERLSSVLKRSGGYTEEAYLRGAVFVRDQLRRQQQMELDRFVKSQEEALLLESARIGAGSLQLAVSGREEAALQAQTMQQRRQLLDMMKSKVVLGRLVVKLDAPETLEGTPSDIPIEQGDVLIVPEQPSTMSTLHSWVETLEFDSGIMSRKLPVNAFLGRIAPLFPLFGFIYERL
jgi:polysaccharide biosynthesis/export protein